LAPGLVTIEVIRAGRQLDLDVQPISGFRVSDNGIGLDDNNFDSFNTAFSPHKLTRGGKGLGRFTWLKAFEHAKITSTFADDQGLHERNFVFDQSYDLDDRRIILDFLDRAISLSDEKKNYPLEKVVHQMVFPMQHSSEDIPSSEQNLWMIDERLTFHSFISSDKRNKSISVLESDDNQRGDIVIFDEKIIFSDERPDAEHPLNSIVVIEFKQPGRTKYTNDENPVLQAANVINAIRAGKYKHKGRSIPIANADIPAMIFVIADLTPRLRKILVDFNANLTPDNQGYYGYHSNYKVYYEVMDYTKMLSDAKKRNRIFFEKLNLVDNR
jgi:hypothetical protein